MTVEVRELYFYMISGRAIDPDLSSFNQDVNYYVISGFNAANPLAVSNVYTIEYYPVLISGGTPNPANVNVINTSWWLVEALTSPLLLGERTGCWAIEACRPADTAVIQTGLWVISDGPAV